ncbi:hypothetical protein OH491_24890 [Termitidicoccus mucosus]|uniref:Uncharacterized protein n=1 Tax=Termitidicoccus mucosus TaxID=1184151 RepID=A0A178IPQ4_9BACT|nr:hypothetical protein AW736_01650 [Opitutaceae bacterium TSB47]
MISVKSKNDDLFHAANPEAVVTAKTRIALRIRTSGHSIPKGTSCSILFGTINDEWALRASGVAGEGDTLFHFSIISRVVTRFFEPPTLEALASEVFSDSICPTVLGGTAEPDGMDEDGSPSWLLALGLI